jgi:threonine/homoserine/homoserine lactone efflux protein
LISAASAAGIAIVALGMVLTPGPNMMYLVSRSLSQSWRAGMISLLGTVTGFLVYLTLASLGLAEVFRTARWLYWAVRLAGAAYLLYLAWQALRPGGTAVFAPQPLPPDPTRRLFTMGLVTNLLNPKIAVLYVALLPQFIDPLRGSIAVQSLVLGSVQICVALTVNTLIVLSAATLSRLLGRRPGWLRAQRYVMGGVLGALAFRLLLTDRARPSPA